MFEHLDDPEGIEPGRLEMEAVVRRAESIRARQGRIVVVASCCVLLAASIAFFFTRPPGGLSSAVSDYQFNLLRDPLPVGSAVPTTALVNVEFASTQDGFALAIHRGMVLLAASSDGGSTWHVRDNRLPPGLGSGDLSPGQMEFIGSTGYLWGGRATAGAPLWVSGDAGATWHEAPIGPYVFDVSAIGQSVWALSGSCPGPAVGASCSVNVEQSPDGGTTWESPGQLQDTVAAPTADPIEPIELARITTTRAYVLTETTNQSQPQWALSFTADSGATWSSRTVPCTASNTDGVAVGASATTDLWIICGGTVAASSQPKELFRSSDGGGSWRMTASSLGTSAPTPTTTSDTLPGAGYVVPLEPGHHNLAVASSATAWLYPSGAGLFKTSDGGTTWVPVPELSTAGFAKGGEGNVTFLSGSAGWICSYGVGLWHTSDGVHWSALGHS